MSSFDHELLGLHISWIRSTDPAVRVAMCVLVTIVVCVADYQDVWFASLLVAALGALLQTCYVCPLFWHCIIWSAFCMLLMLGCIAFLQLVCSTECPCNCLKISK